jgi:hypothetical protein
MIEVTFTVNTITQRLIQIHKSVQKLHHLKSLNFRHFGVIDVTFNVITSIQNFMQVHQLVKILSWGFFAPTSEVQTSAILQ